MMKSRFAWKQQSWLYIFSLKKIMQFYVTCVSENSSFFKWLSVFFNSNWFKMYHVIIKYQMRINFLKLKKVEGRKKSKHTLKDRQRREIWLLILFDYFLSQMQPVRNFGLRCNRVSVLHDFVFTIQGLVSQFFGTLRLLT